MITYSVLLVHHRDGNDTAAIYKEADLTGLYITLVQRLAFHLKAVFLPTIEFVL